jgi:hypothetical protein
MQLPQMPHAKSESMRCKSASCAGFMRIGASHSHEFSNTAVWQQTVKQNSDSASIEREHVFGLKGNEEVTLG